MGARAVVLLLAAEVVDGRAVVLLLAASLLVDLLPVGLLVGEVPAGLATVLLHTGRPNLTALRRANRR